MYKKNKYWYWEDHCDIPGGTKYKKISNHPKTYQCWWGKCNDQRGGAAGDPAGVEDAGVVD